ncbi:hypothetical protein Btru_071268, partial [Bulinus truncatus]
MHFTECKVEDKECEKDKVGLEAIRTLHHLIDDDQNGNVDQSESDEHREYPLQILAPSCERARPGWDGDVYLLFPSQ